MLVLREFQTVILRIDKEYTMANIYEPHIYELEHVYVLIEVCSFLELVAIFLIQSYL